MCRVDEQGFCREGLQVSGLVILLVLSSGNERAQVREGQDADRCVRGRMLMEQGKGASGSARYLLNCREFIQLSFKLCPFFGKLYKHNKRS